MEPLRDFAKKQLGELIYVCGVVTDIVNDNAQLYTNSFVIRIRDCSLDPNCAKNNCLGQADFGAVDHYLALCNPTSVLLMIWKLEKIPPDTFYATVFTGQHAALQIGDVIFVFASVCNSVLTRTAVLLNVVNFRSVSVRSLAAASVPTLGKRCTSGVDASMANCAICAPAAEMSECRNNWCIHHTEQYDC